MLGEIRGQLKGMHEKMDETLEQVKKTNGRVNALENWKANLMGKIAILTAIVGSCSAYVAKKIFG